VIDDVPSPLLGETSTDIYSSLFNESIEITMETRDEPRIADTL